MMAKLSGHPNMFQGKVKKKPSIEHCKHCSAPGHSIFDNKHILTTTNKYVLDTEDFRVTRTFDKELSSPKFVKDPVKLKKFKSHRSLNQSVLDSRKPNPLNLSAAASTFISEQRQLYNDYFYYEKLQEALIGREKWKKIQMKIIVQTYQQKTRNAGPEWFQDLSPYQMELTDNLAMMLQADLEDGRTPRTQEYLFEVGIAPDIPPSLVAKIVKESEGNPLVFLFKIHEALVYIETGSYEKSFWEAKKQQKYISPFSINERILLTCAFHIHFPKFLQKLDKILPSKEAKPVVKWGKKPPKPKKKQYASPYLEPVPISERPWYEDRVEEEFKRKVLRQMKRQKDTKEKKEFGKKLDEQRRRLQEEYESKARKKQITGPTVHRSKYEETNDYMDDSEVTESKFPWDTDSFPERERKSDLFKNFMRSQSIISKGSAPHLAGNINSKKKLDETAASADWTSSISPELCLEIMASDGRTQTPIRGIVQESLYAANMEEELDNEEGITPAYSLKIRKAPNGQTQDRWTMTPYSKNFQPLKQAMRDFLLKQKAVEKQMEKFCKASLYKRGIFGPPTNDTCKTSCLLDLERMAINREITVIKSQSVDLEDDMSLEECSYLEKKKKVPRDFSVKELVTVKRYLEEGMGKRMSGPPIPGSPYATKDALEGGASNTLDEYIKAKDHINKTEQKEVDKDQNPCKKPLPVECRDSQCELINEDELPIDEYTLAMRRIATLPEKRQLVAAVNYLSDKGDPVAILPNIEHVPWLVRWFDIRCGQKTKLSQQDKDELMERSKKYWTAQYIHCTAAPLPLIPKKTFTWDNKKWLMESLDKKLYEHRRKGKHILIDNARDLFPTMFCEYFNSPLNKTFRKTFYAYFPSRERDCYVVNPWDSSAKDTEEDGGN